VKKNPYSVLLGKPDGKRPVGRSSCRYEDNIKMNLRERGLGNLLHLFGFFVHGHNVFRKGIRLRNVKIR
jgi:hypothetical protein